MSRERPTRQQLSLGVQRKGLESLLNESKAFRVFLFELFTDASIFYPTYSRGSPHDTSYAEGRRALGLEVLHKLKYVRPDILGLIEREGNLLSQQIEALAQAAPDREDPHEDLSAELDDPDAP